MHLCAYPCDPCECMNHLQGLIQAAFCDMTISFDTECSPLLLNPLIVNAVVSSYERIPGLDKVDFSRHTRSCRGNYLVLYQHSSRSKVPRNTFLSIFTLGHSRSISLLFIASLTVVGVDKIRVGPE